MANLRSQQANADTQIANAKSLASEYQKTITEQNKIIQQQQAAAAASGRSSGGSSGGSGGTSKPNSNASVPGGNLNPPKTTNVSGSDVVNYAMQFVGKPYVWGGKVQTVVDLPAMSMHTSESASQVFPVPREAAVRKSAMRMHRQVT